MTWVTVCPVCGGDPVPAESEDDAVQGAGQHDDTRHEGVPTAEARPVAAVAAGR